MRPVRKVSNSQFQVSARGGERGHASLWRRNNHLGRRISDVDQHDLLLQTIRIIVIIDVTAANLTNQRRKAIKFILVKLMRDDRSGDRYSSFTTPGRCFSLGLNLFLELFPLSAKALGRAFASGRVEIETRTSSFPHSITALFSLGNVHCGDVDWCNDRPGDYVTLSVVFC